MLVLTRRQGQRIIIPLGDEQYIIIEVCRLGAGCVRLGVIAPEDMQIFREEVLQNVQANGARKPRLAIT